ncbi:MAG: hypothetical protein ACRC62_15650 [Microcoleus sp.]
MRHHYQLSTPIATPSPSPSPTPTVVDLSPVTDRLAEIEAKLLPSTEALVPTASPSVIRSSSVVNPGAVATTSPAINSEDYTGYWLSESLSDGDYFYNPMYEAVWAKVTWLSTGGYEFKYSGIYSSSSGSNQPWTLRETNSDGTTMSRAVLPASLAPASRSFTFTGKQVSVSIPGSAKTFVSRKPQADITTGWTRSQDTRLQAHKYLYQANNRNVLIHWGKDNCYLVCWGENGGWGIEHETTTTQPQQTLQISGTNTSSLLLEGGVSKVRVNTTGNISLTLHRPPNVVTWESIEMPDIINEEQFDWNPPRHYIGDVCFYEWTNPNNFQDYIRISYFPSTIIEHVIGGVYQNDWYRLTRADGSTIEAKDTQHQYTNERFALIEVWAYSGGNDSIPPYQGNFYLPIPTIPGDKNLVPQLWTQYLDRLQFNESVAGKAIAPISTAVTQLQTENTVLKTKLAAIEKITTDNLTDLSLGTIDPTSADSSRFFIPFRSGVKIKEITFNFRDRRVATYPSRILNNVSITGAQMSPIGGNGWTYSTGEDNRHSMARALSVTSIEYLVVIQWIYCPTGITLWFQESHSNTNNTYGRFENVVVKWEKS